MPERPDDSGGAQRRCAVPAGASTIAGRARHSFWNVSFKVADLLNSFPLYTKDSALRYISVQAFIHEGSSRRILKQGEEFLSFHVSPLLILELQRLHTGGFLTPTTRLMMTQTYRLCTLSVCCNACVHLFLDESKWKWWSLRKIWYLLLETDWTAVYYCAIMCIIHDK